MYKMYLISTEGYKNVKVEFLTIKTTSEIWVSMKDVGSGMGVKNISDLVLKEIYGICETKNPSKEQVNEYKIIGDSEIPKCPKLEAKSKIGKIFKKHNPLKEYSVKIYEIDSYFYKHYEKKYKLIKMGVNIYYLELMFILINFY